MPTFTNSVDGNENAIEGISVDGRGVVGRSETNYGMRAHSKKIAGLRASSDESRGVEGWATKSEGVVGISEMSSGVAGSSKTGVGVHGSSTDGRGVEGWSDTQYGVAGESKKSAGIRGTSADGRGVEGWSTKSEGVVGFSTTSTGVWGNTEGAGTGVAGTSKGGIGVHGKGGRLAGLFEGNVDITGNLTIQNVSIQIWLQRIVHLEQQVADLSRQIASQATAGGGGTGTQAFIAATLSFNPGGSSVDARILTVSGQGFNAGENVNLKIVYRAGQTESPNPPENVQTTANGMGVFYFTRAVLCGSDVTRRPSWQLSATGSSSGRQSNVANAGC